MKNYIKLKKDNMKLKKENKKLELEINAMYEEMLIKNNKYYLIPKKLFEELWEEYTNKPIQYVRENKIGLIYKDEYYIQDITVNKIKNKGE